LNTAVTKTVRTAAPGLRTSQIVVRPFLMSETCPANATAGRNATVDATYPFTYDIPFVGRRNIQLKATGVMQCGG